MALGGVAMGCTSLYMTRTGAKCPRGKNGTLWDSIYGLWTRTGQISAVADRYSNVAHMIIWPVWAQIELWVSKLLSPIAQTKRFRLKTLSNLFVGSYYSDCVMCNHHPVVTRLRTKRNIDRQNLFVFLRETPLL